jgi:hypothetical protein
MDVLKQQVGRAHFRMTMERFLACLSWSCFASLLIAAVFIVVDKFKPLGVHYAVWLGSGMGVGVLAAMICTWFTRRKDLDAAIEIDRRFGLKERVSSTLAMTATELESPLGRALADDAAKRVERVHVAEKFPVRLNRWAWLPLAPAAFAFLLATFWHPAIGENPAVATPDQTAVKKQIKESSTVLRKKLADRREQAKKEGLKDAADLFQKLEQGTKQLQQADQADRQQAMIKLNDLAKELEKRRQELGGDKLKEQLNQLKNMKQGPADKLGQALKNGDMKQALNELQKLKEQLEQGKLDDQAKADLAKQMAEMEDKLKQLAEAHQKAQEELQKQISEKRAAGKSEEANELEKQLSKLADQTPQMDQLKKLSDKLGECSKCMQKGDQEGAAKSLDSMKSELSKLEDKMSEMKMLDEAMDEMAQCKDGMCQGQGQGAGKGKKPGKGMGAGRGEGARPEEKNKTGVFDTRVKQKIGKGAAVVTDFVDGPNVKGKVQQEIQTQFESAKAQETDPLSGQQLPKGYREHAKKYFDALREGEK